MALDQEGVSLVDTLYNEIGDRMGLLMTNPFGNYLFQKIVEMSSDAQRRNLVMECRGCDVQLKNVQQTLCAASKDLYGTRCVQKLIRVSVVRRLNSSYVDCLIW